MSDPKGPPSSTDGSNVPVRKSSKKSSSSSSSRRVESHDAPPSYSTATAPQGPSLGIAGATATTSSLSTDTPPSSSPVVTVPRIPIAEPKYDSTQSTEAKQRSSKKRTSTSTTDAPTAPGVSSGSASGPPLASARTAVSPSAESTTTAPKPQDTAADAAEKERQAARREAKRQRAKELEEQKKREELAKQALLDAQRQEEQRQRELRQKQQLAALNANAEECQEEEPDEGDEYGDDGFENYEDDFEADDKPPTVAKAPQTKAKATSKGTKSTIPSAEADELEVRKIQQALQAESKEFSASASSRPPSSSSAAPPLTAKSTSKSTSQQPQTSIASSIAGLKQSIDPRAKRAKEILETRRFDVEKSSLFQQAPVSEQEYAMHKLRRGTIRQAFVQASEGAKVMATQTKPPRSEDKSMHFPDDIGVDTGSKAAYYRGKNQDREDNDEEDQNATSTVRFFKFLEHAAYVCEILAEENIVASEQEQDGHEDERTGKSHNDKHGKRLTITSQTSMTGKQIVPNKQQMTDKHLKSLTNLLRGRDLVAIRFAHVVSNILVTSYGLVQSDSEAKVNSSQMWRNKSLSCVWDVNQPNSVLHVLKNEGLITTTCLAPTRDLFVLAGTEDGSLHIWDLRPQSTSIVTSTEDGLRVHSPTYSTCGVDYKALAQHTSTIVALDGLPRNLAGGSNAMGSSNRSFQFASMDDRGILIIWSVIEFDAGDDALLADKCVEIGGRIKTVMNARIDTQQQYLVPLSQVNNSKKTGMARTSSSSSSALRRTPSTSPFVTNQIGPIATTFQFFPHDPNQFVVGTRTGLLLHGHRFAGAEGDKSLVPTHYRRDNSNNIAAFGGVSAIGVVCIDFHPFQPEYFLAGYEDGSICLFHCNISPCLSMWEEMPFGVSVCAIQWSKTRPGVFMASFSNALVLVWDLLSQTNAPVLTRKLHALKDISPVELASELYPLVLSSDQIRTSRPAVAWRCGDAAPFQFMMYELNPEFTTRFHDEQQQVRQVLSSIV